MASTFESFTLLHVPGDQNERADLQNWPTLRKGSSKRKGTWTSPFITYLKEDRLLEDPREAKKMVREASKYILLGQHLCH
ncbi:hypothetical protein CR513_24368, partial [Mucuna pruriens]